MNPFFHLQRRFFSKPAWPHFGGLVMAMSVGVEHTVGRLNRLLRGHTHCTNDGEFLWRSHWDEWEVLRAIAWQQFSRLYRPGEPIYLVIDDTQTLKRAKSERDQGGSVNEAVGTLDHHIEKRYATGHTLLKACLYYRGVTIPWGSWLYVKREHAAGLDVPFALVTHDLQRANETVVGDYRVPAKRVRWSIELLIQDEKQHWGLGAYRVRRYRAVVRHLHLVDCAYACLTHVGLQAQRAQGRKDAKSVLRLPPIRQLKQELRQRVWNEAIKNVAKVSHERAVIRRLEKLLAA